MIPTDEEIYSYFLGDVVVGDMYRSPMPDRPKNDTSPSFGLYEKDGRILWKDFGSSDASGNKPVNFVMDYLKVSYAQAMRIIETEVKTGMIGRKVKLSKRRKGDVLPSLVKRREFTQGELNYWLQYGIEEEDLIREDIYALDRLAWLPSGGGQFESSTDEIPIFIYWFNDSPASWKKYRPEARNEGQVIATKDFLTWNVTDVVEGWNSYPDETDLTIITSSTKDRACVKKCKYDSLNPTGENAYNGLLLKKDEINKRSKRVLIMLDADEPGFKASKKLSELTGWDYWDMRVELRGEKDFSDYAKEYGIDSLTSLLNKLTHGKH